MGLSVLESADTIETKAFMQCRFRIVWDHLGWFLPQVVPYLFPPNNSSDFTRMCKDFLDRRLTALYSSVGSVKKSCPSHRFQGEAFNDWSALLRPLRLNCRFGRDSPRILVQQCPEPTDHEQLSCVLWLFVPNRSFMNQWLNQRIVGTVITKAIVETRSIEAASASTAL
jgi:hypothetical protein